VRRAHRAVADPFYRFSRWLFDRSTRIYYRRIDVEGRENLPAGPAIIVANHPNSIADGFLLMSQIPRPVCLIAKDSIVRIPVVGWLARRCGVIGVARQTEYRDRQAQRRQINLAAIQGCAPRLAAGGMILIFGEGISSDSRRLQSIRKGAMRIGYAAEETNEFRLGVAFVPVGINYSSKNRFRSEALIRIGRPFRLRDVSAEPERDKAHVLAAGTARLQAEIEALTTNIVAEELAPLVDRLAELRSSARRLSPALWFEAQKQIAEALHYWNQTAPRRVLALRESLAGYDRALEQAELSDETVRQRRPRVALAAGVTGLARSLALLAVYLYGWANSIGPRYLGRASLRFSRAGRKLGERIRGRPSEFGVTKETASAQVGGWIGAGLFYPAQIYLVGELVRAGWGWRAGVASAAVYAFTLIPAWLFSLRHSERMQHDWQQARAAWDFLRRPRPALRLRQRRRRLAAEVEALVRAYEAPARRAARGITQ